jgi:hypothetical protein
VLLAGDKPRFAPGEQASRMIAGGEGTRENVGFPKSTEAASPRLAAYRRCTTTLSPSLGPTRARAYLHMHHIPACKS